MKSVCLKGIKSIHNGFTTALKTGSPWSPIRTPKHPRCMLTSLTTGFRPTMPDLLAHGQEGSRQCRSGFLLPDTRVPRHGTSIDCKSKFPLIAILLLLPERSLNPLKAPIEGVGVVVFDKSMCNPIAV